MNKTILAIFAHPDDAEMLCAGTLLLMKKAGWDVHIATMTPGDKGTAVHSIKEISDIRKEEAVKAAKLAGGTYTCLGFEDVYILYNCESINRTTALMRNVKPSVVITASPNDYMIDHEVTSRIVQTACFSAGIKNMDVKEKPYDFIPYLYYSDPVESKDIFGRNIDVPIYIDITGVMNTKEKMLACHKSQRSWLLAHHKMDEYIMSMKRHAENRGKEINTRYAEGFRQHLGHSFPQDNILKEQLKKLCVVRVT
jgi:LmbE family N-acetylglucosaminyl deacetylase